MRALGGIPCSCQRRSAAPPALTPAPHPAPLPIVKDDGERGGAGASWPGRTDRTFPHHLPTRNRLALARALGLGFSHNTEGRGMRSGQPREAGGRPAKGAMDDVTVRANQFGHLRTRRAVDRRMGRKRLHRGVCRRQRTWPGERQDSAACLQHVRLGPGAGGRPQRPLWRRLAQSAGRATRADQGSPGLSAARQFGPRSRPAGDGRHRGLFGPDSKTLGGRADAVFQRGGADRQTRDAVPRHLALLSGERPRPAAVDDGTAVLPARPEGGPYAVGARHC